MTENEVEKVNISQQQYNQIVNQKYYESLIEIRRDISIIKSWVVARGIATVGGIAFILIFIILYN